MLVFACTVVCRCYHQRSAVNLQFLLSTVELWTQWKGGRVEDPLVNYIPITSLRGHSSQGSVWCCYLFLTCRLLVCRVYFEMHLGTTAQNTESQENFYFSSWFSTKATQKNVRVCSHVWAITPVSCVSHDKQWGDITASQRNVSGQSGEVLLCEHLGEKHDSDHMWLQIP